MTNYLKQILFNQPKVDYHSEAKQINQDKDFIRILQKELVQNSWSAVKTKSRFSLQTKNNWSLMFHLTTDSEDNPILVVTETRKPTHRLRSNTVVDPTKNNDNDRLMFNQDEHLNTHWINPRSKLIFLAASEDRIIGYENYGQINQYHFGVVGLGKERFYEKNHHDEEAVKTIKKSFGLEPLSKLGSRIIIYNPIKSVTDSVKNGKIAKNIAETWWPNIADHQVDIQIQIDQEEPLLIEVPERFIKLIAKPKPKDEDDEKYYQKRNIKFKHEDKTYAIKHVYFGWKKDRELEKRQQGIFCFCNGQLMFVMDWSDDDLQEQAVGCIEFGPELSGHLSDQLEDSLIWKKIKIEIISQIDLFNRKNIKTDSSKVKSLAERIKQSSPIRARFAFRQKK